MLGRRIAVCCGGLLLVGVTGVAAQRAEVKYHQIVHIGNELAEYTVIVPMDENSPRISRHLYQHSQGERLVVRSTSYFVEGALPQTSSFTTSVESIDTGETMELSLDEDDTITVVLGGGSVSWVDGPEVPEEVQQQAVTLLANVSTEFSDALYRLGEAGIAYSMTFNTIGTVIAELLFPGQLVVVSLQNAEQVPTEVVQNFDPNVHPPGPFEQPFGNHYYE